MKIRLKYFLFTMIFLTLGVASVLADPPGPPGPGGDPGGGGGVPVGAPIDDGVYVLLGLALFYVGYKYLYDLPRNRSKAAADNTSENVKID